MGYHPANFLNHFSLIFCAEHGALHPRRAVCLITNIMEDWLSREGLPLGDERVYCRICGIKRPFRRKQARQHTKSLTHQIHSFRREMEEVFANPLQHRDDNFKDKVAEKYKQLDDHIKESVTNALLEEVADYIRKNYRISNFIEEGKHIEKIIAGSLSVSRSKLNSIHEHLILYLCSITEIYQDTSYQTNDFYLALVKKMRNCEQLLRGQCYEYEGILSPEGDCVVCLDELQSPAVRLPCRHMFCRGCIEGWMRVSDIPRCPTCRGEIFPAKNS